MSPQQQRQLVRAAIEARRHARAAYSKFRVGAALLTRRGTIVAGANMESASYGLSCCAERVALFKALSEDGRGFQAIAVAARMPHGPMPCGACRQLLAEYAPGITVLIVDSRVPGQIRSFPLQTLLPQPFLGKRAGL